MWVERGHTAHMRMIARLVWNGVHTCAHMRARVCSAYAWEMHGGGTILGLLCEQAGGPWEGEARLSHSPTKGRRERLPSPSAVGDGCEVCTVSPEMHVWRYLIFHTQLPSPSIIQSSSNPHHLPAAPPTTHPHPRTVCAAPLCEPLTRSPSSRPSPAGAARAPTPAAPCSPGRNQSPRSA